ncbi:hypothetical protein RND71_006066 [Anisodus tanguticus]|uniref:Uncharacterized protein n=1 Tax=Anisodus tanguticus TaxID=243964 RepID=A0AAE1SRA0_9SOLA|nr:hypothetical protein RND71_006066 [Anisodus tanguticus]
MKITSDRITQLIVYDCRNLIAAELDTPNLKRFSYDYHTLKLKGSVLLKANISLASAETPDNNLYRNLVNFLGYFNSSMAIELSSENDKAIVIPKHKREKLLPPLYGAKSVHVNINNRLNHSIVDVVDSLLWICPKLETLYFCGTLNLKTLKTKWRSLDKSRVLTLLQTVSLLKKIDCSY